ncbi:hypothetical protein LCGC14_1364660 [marine sediment metagenome]|uniref:Uncharacterized protein n=1 Tax=marine sediment metagenome TaxID=412755 RepID=A0A0F9N968_9ZZZZ
MSSSFIKNMKDRHKIGVKASKEAKRQLDFAKEIGVDVSVQEVELAELDIQLEDIDKAIKKQETARG